MTDPVGTGQVGKPTLDKGRVYDGYLAVAVNIGGYFVEGIHRKRRKRPLDRCRVKDDHLAVAVSVPFERRFNDERHRGFSGVLPFTGHDDAVRSGFDELFGGFFLLPGIIDILFQHLSVILDDGHEFFSVRCLSTDNGGTDIEQLPIGLIRLIGNVDLITVDICDGSKGIESAPVIIDIADIGDIGDIRIDQSDRAVVIFCDGKRRLADRQAKLRK